MLKRVWALGPFIMPWVIFGLFGWSCKIFLRRSWFRLELNTLARSWSLRSVQAFCLNLCIWANLWAVRAFGPNLDFWSGSSLEPKFFTLHNFWTSRGELWIILGVWGFRPKLAPLGRTSEEFGLLAWTWVLVGVWALGLFSCLRQSESLLVQLWIIIGEFEL